MADPILADIWKAQCVFQSNTGLPEDVFVNSFYFRNDEDLGTAPVGAIKRVLDAFYNAPAANGIALSTRMSPIVLPAWKIRIYDLGEPPPRTRHEQTGVALTRPTGTSALISEQAVSASFFAGQNRPRYRGRVYLGPWASTAVEYVGSTGEPIVKADLRLAIADRCKMMVETTENVTWVLVSKGGTSGVIDPPNAKVISAGWVDDAWDIQRRRGRAATGRSLWTGDVGPPG